MRAKLISAPYTIWMALFIIVPMGLVAGSYTHLAHCFRKGFYAGRRERSLQ